MITYLVYILTISNTFLFKVALYSSTTYAWETNRKILLTIKETGIYEPRVVTKKKKQGTKSGNNGPKEMNKYSTES